MRQQGSGLRVEYQNGKNVECVRQERGARQGENDVVCRRQRLEHLLPVAYHQLRARQVCRHHRPETCAAGVVCVVYVWVGVMKGVSDLRVG